ncbi:MAG: cupin domain-containing protein [Anaerolineales bacterium]|nr:cupin domain-containing protein [Anaerolineales bacterium]MCX7754659.1 cupin domain-containing protein [Anaerolineales bacterium]MDW8278321.1 cupin domain-containing protein [Anaerolineales bacterium]
MYEVHLIRWAGPGEPNENAIRKLLDGEALSYYAWGNEPLDTYAAHTHPYHKVLYVIQGSITFHLPQSGQSLTLRPGDRLELPAGTIHSATVGIEGVQCLEAHLQAG